MGQVLATCVKWTNRNPNRKLTTTDLCRWRPRRASTELHHCLPCLGLNDPLEFLGDVVIDAPLALPHMATIVAELTKAEVVPFGFLLTSPEYFRTDQNAAGFGAKVLKKIGDAALTSEEYIDVVEKLMTEKDKEEHGSAGALIAAA